MRQRFAVVLTAVAATGGVTAHAQSGSRAVRPEDAGIRALVARGLERSATFRQLHTRLDASDVVVYVRFSRCPDGVAACLAWVSATAGVRRLLITLDKFGRSPDELTALLAHELQHANEVASVPGITDMDSFRKAFASLGWKHGDGFETEEAKIVTRRVAAELRRAGRRTIICLSLLASDLATVALAKVARSSSLAQGGSLCDGSSPRSRSLLG